MNWNKIEWRIITGKISTQTRMLEEEEIEVENWLNEKDDFLT